MWHSAGGRHVKALESSQQSAVALRLYPYVMTGLFEIGFLYGGG